MGLNMNYTLLMEGANKQFDMPEYKSVYISPCYEEAYILETINDLRLEIINSNYELINIYENVENLDEAGILRNFDATVNKMLRGVLATIKKMASALSSVIRRFISYLKGKLYKRPEEITKYTPAQYMDILVQALNKGEYYINIPNIEPSDAIKDNDFPTTKLQSLDKLIDPLSDLTDIVTNINSMGSEGIKYSGLTIKNIESRLADVKAEAVTELIGDRVAKLGYRDLFEPGGTKYAKFAADVLFGTTAIKNTEVTVGLYETARINMDRSDEVLEYAASLDDKIKSAYNKMYDTTNKLLNLINNKLSNTHTYTNGPYANQGNALKETLSGAQLCTSIIADLISSHYILVNHKISRLYQIYGPSSGSAQVLHYCDNIVLNEIKETEPPIDDFSENAIESCISEMNYEIELARGALIEASFNIDIHNAIMNEADVAGAAAKAKNTIAGFIDRVIQAVSNAVNNFVNKVNEVVAGMDKGWWQNNKGRIAKLDVSKVTVNSWYNYTLDKFNKSSYVQWDENSNDFDSDENMQKAIFNKIGGTPTTDDDASFTDKVKSLYYSKYINNDTGEGTPFANIGLDRADMDKFIEDFLNGNNGGILKSIKQELSDINKDAKEIKNKYKDQTGTATETNASSTSSTEGTESGTGTATNTNNTQESYEIDNMTYLKYLNEASFLSSKQRNNLPDSAFGLPKERRYPMPDEKHVLLAIKFFNHVEPEKEKELAKNIIKKIKEFDMADRVKVGDKNRFKPYWEKSGLSKTSKKLTEAEELFSFNLADTLGLYNEQTITGLEEAEVKVSQDTVDKNSANAGGGSGNNAMRAKITRCFKYNSQATGAKMTQAFKAYKQYISFYKSVLNSIDSGKGNDKAAKEQQQNKEANK